MWWLSRGCGGTVGMWWLRGCGCLVGMWWLSGDVVAQWGCGGSGGYGSSEGDVVAQWVKSTGQHQPKDATVPSSNPAHP
jgi:hypothetical protein